MVILDAWSTSSEVIKGVVETCTAPDWLIARLMAVAVTVSGRSAIQKTSVSP
jgi:hypothetical protein